MMSEFRKLRPWTVRAAIAGLLLLSVLVFRYQSAAEAQYIPWAQELERLEALCDTDPAARECRPTRDLASARQQVDYVVDQHPHAAAMQDPVGIGGAAAGFLGSLPGAIVVAALAAVYVAGEWREGTIRILLTRNPSRFRFVLVKFVSLWVASVLTLLVVWLGLAVLSVVLEGLFPRVPPGPTNLDVKAWAVGRAARAVLVIGFFASLGTIAAVITQSTLGTVGFVMVATFVFQLSAALEALVPLSPGYWVSSWMDFEPSGLWGDHIWVDRFPFLDPSAAVEPRALLGIAAIGVVSACSIAFSHLRLRTSDLLT